MYRILNLCYIEQLMGVYKISCLEKDRFFCIVKFMTRYIQHYNKPALKFPYKVDIQPCSNSSDTGKVYKVATGKYR
jgi:hypothetical protein